jgi:hypothetical protein
MEVDEIGSRTHYIKAKYKLHNTVNVIASDHFFYNAAIREVNLALVHRVVGAMSQKPIPLEGEQAYKTVVTDGKYAIIAVRTKRNEIILVNCLHFRNLKEDHGMEIHKVKQPNTRLVITRHFEERYKSRQINLRLFETIDKQLAFAYPRDGYLVSDGKDSILVNVTKQKTCVLVTCYENSIDDWEDFKFVREHVKHENYKLKIPQAHKKG